MNVISDLEINNYQNGVVLSKEVKTNTFILIGQLNNDVLIDGLIKDVKEEVKKGENLYKNKTNVQAIHTEFDSLSSRPNVHKFFGETQPSIYKIYQKNFWIREVWGNIYSKSDEDYTKEHNHGETSGFCGIIYLTDGPGPGTYFREYDLLVPEKKGRFVFFHPLLYHEVKPYKYTQERITIAFNLFEIKSWVDYSQAYIVNKKIKI
jgi:hypothetical protein